MNPDKSFWTKAEVAYIEFLMNQQGIKPQLEKIKGMRNIKPPKNKKYLKQFIGIVNYHKELFRKRSDILKPLTDMFGKKFTFIWGKRQTKSLSKPEQ